MTVQHKKTARQDETRSVQPQDAQTADAYMPRKMSFAENVILTIKVLGGFGLLGAALWGASLLTAAK